MQPQLVETCKSNWATRKLWKKWNLQGSLLTTVWETDNLPTSRVSKYSERFNSGSRNHAFHYWVAVQIVSCKCKNDNIIRSCCGRLAGPSLPVCTVQETKSWLAVLIRGSLRILSENSRVPYTYDSTSFSRRLCCTYSLTDPYRKSTYVPSATAVSTPLHTT